MDFYPKKVTLNFRELFFWLKFPDFDLAETNMIFAYRFI